MMMSYIPLGPHVYTCTDRFHEPIGAVGSLGPFVESEHDRTVAQASFFDLLFQLIFNVIFGNLKESSVSQGWPPRASHPLIPPQRSFFSASRMAYFWDPMRKQGLLVVFLVAGTTLLCLLGVCFGPAGSLFEVPATVAGGALFEVPAAGAGALFEVPVIMASCLHVL